MITAMMVNAKHSTTLMTAMPQYMPETALFSQVAQDENGYLLADESTRTNLPGVFAAGDLRTKPLRQIITAAADGAVAVQSAEHYLQSIEN